MPAPSAARAIVTFYLSSQPDEQFEAHGIDPAETKAIVEVLGTGDLEKAYEMTTPEIADKLSIAGTPEECVAKIKEMESAGVNHMILCITDPYILKLFAHRDVDVPDVEGQLELNPLLATSIGDADANIDTVSMERADGGGDVAMFFGLQVRDRRHLANLMRALRRVPDVRRVQRARRRYAPRRSGAASRAGPPPAARPGGCSSPRARAGRSGGCRGGAACEAENQIGGC